MLIRVGAAAVALGLSWALVGNLAAQKEPARPAPGKPQPKQGEVKPVVIQEQLNDKDGFDKVRGGCRCKVHIVKMVPGREYTIRMDSNQIDSYLRLEDSNGTQLAQDDDSGGNLNAKIVFTPTKADNYRIIATTFAGGMTGPYTLSVRPSGERKVVLNVNGQITNADPFDVQRQSCHHRLHTFKMVAGKSYNIQMNSNQFAPCLRLEDALGNQINQAASGIGQTQLEFIPPKTDTYRIIITTLGASQTGMYSLVVAEQ
jgi:hypothetical protein